MNLLLSRSVCEQLLEALDQGGRREVGGILMGEHIGPDTFRVTDLTVQLKGGTFAAFVRLVSSIVEPLRTFFRTTNHNYTRFNYIGEWHSHHSFALTPSSRDHLAMMEILNDSRVGARFVALLLVKRNRSGVLEHSVTVYTKGNAPRSGAVLSD